MIDNETKRYLVEKLSPYFSPEELSKRFPIKPHSVRYHANVMGVPTHAAYRKQQKAKMLKAFEDNLQIQRREELLQVMNELSPSIGT